MPTAAFIIAIVYTTIQSLIVVVSSVVSLWSIETERKRNEILDHIATYTIKAHDRSASISQSSRVVNTKDVDNTTKGNICYCCPKWTKIWFQTTWKMRSIYSSFAVHIFDYMTDLLVISEWYEAERGNKEVDNVDSRLMANLSVSVLIFYKIISSIAVYYATEGNRVRTFLQFWDLLLFEEILVCHKKAVRVINSKRCKTPGSQLQTQARISGVNINSVNNKVTIEATNRFKFIRSIEALFESTPQAVLQLVYVIRTSNFSNPIFLISIFQSILSMTNSMLNFDGTYMVSSTFKLYKKRLPPSGYFLKHFLIRLSEISHRIFLLSLFWVVVGGLGFCILLIFEIGPLLFWRDWDDAFLVLNQIVVVPAQRIFSTDINFYVACGFCPCFSTGIIATITTWLKTDKIYFFTTLRIGMSLVELIIISIFGTWYQRKDNNYLWDKNHGFWFFIVSVVFFIIYTQFAYLMPYVKDLPNNLQIRSKWYYAFLGNIRQLGVIMGQEGKDIQFWNESSPAVTQFSDAELMQRWLEKSFDAAHKINDVKLAIIVNELFIKNNFKTMDDIANASKDDINTLSSKYFDNINKINKFRYEKYYTECKDYFRKVLKTQGRSDYVFQIQKINDVLEKHKKDIEQNNKLIRKLQGNLIDIVENVTSILSNTIERLKKLKKEAKEAQDAALETELEEKENSKEKEKENKKKKTQLPRPEEIVIPQMVNVTRINIADIFEVFLGGTWSMPDPEKKFSLEEQRKKEKEREKIKPIVLSLKHVSDKNKYLEQIRELALANKTNEGLLQREKELKEKIDENQSKILRISRSLSKLKQFDDFRATEEKKEEVKEIIEQFMAKLDELKQENVSFWQLKQLPDAPIFKNSNNIDMFSQDRPKTPAMRTCLSEDMIEIKKVFRKLRYEYFDFFNRNKSCVLYALANEQFETVEWMIDNNLVSNIMLLDKRFRDRDVEYFRNFLVDDNGYQW